MRQVTLSAHSSEQLQKSERLFLALICAMVVGLCVAVVTAPKIIEIGGVMFPCCNIFFSLLTFPITDTLSEVYGKQYANKAVIIGFLAQFSFVFLLQFALKLPGQSGQYVEAYQALFSATPRFLLASMIAFLVSQFWDVYIYAVLKHLCKGRWLWLRNNLSTMSSQAINSILLIGIGFTSHPQLGKLILGSIILKMIIALIDTPLVYILVNVSHRYLGKNSVAFTAKM